MILGMKQKTSITLDEDLLEELDRLALDGSSRSSLIEQAVREYVLRRRREERDARDLALLDEAADELNRETSDVLGYQALP